MKVLKAKQRWSDDNQKYHLVENKKWLQGQHDKLMGFQLLFWCGKKHWLVKDDKYIDYEKDKHRKELCEECRRMIKLAIRHEKEKKTS